MLKKTILQYLHIYKKKGQKMKLEKLFNDNTEITYELQSRSFLHLSQDEEYVGMISNLGLHPIELKIQKWANGSYCVRYKNCIFMCNDIEEIIVKEELL